MQYQFFGAVPLVASASLAAKNGIDLYQVNNGALVRLVHMLLENVDNSSSFQRKTGIHELEPFRDGKVPQTHIGWLVLVDKGKLSAEDNAKIAQLLQREEYQRLDLPALGGDVRLLSRGS